MNTLFILSLVLNLLLVGLLLFLRYRYKQLADYTRKADRERLQMALELGEMKEREQFLQYKQN